MSISGSTATHPSVRPYHQLRCAEPCSQPFLVRGLRRRLLPRAAPGDVVDDAALRDARRRTGARRRRRAALRAAARRAPATRPRPPPASWRRSPGSRARCACSWAPAPTPRVPALAAALGGSAPSREVFRLERRGGRHRARPGARSRALLGADPRVAYVERDRALRLAADPFDTVDSRPEARASSTRGPTTRCGAARGPGRRRRRLAAQDRRGGHRRGREPPRAGRAASRGTYDICSRRAARDRPGGARHVRRRPDLGRRRQRHRRQGRGRATRGCWRCARRATGELHRAATLVRGIEAAVRTRRRRDQPEPGRPGLLASARRARSRPPSTTTCCRWPRRATTAQTATRSSSPPPPSAARAGARGIGLSVTRHAPGRRAARFSNHNDYVSLAAPGRGRRRLRARRVLDPAGQRARRELGRPALAARALVRRRAAGASPTARARASRPRSSSGIAALVWQVQPRLPSEQVAARADPLGPADRRAAAGTSSPARRGGRRRGGGARPRSTT